MLTKRAEQHLEIIPQCQELIPDPGHRETQVFPGDNLESRTVASLVCSGAISARCKASASWIQMILLPQPPESVCQCPRL
ncbi:hypothetical protein AAY473_022795 [Plecturocebus cupreus]